MPIDTGDPDNQAINHVIGFNQFTGTLQGGDIGLVFNISETGQDLTVTLQNLYLQIASTDGTSFFAYLDPSYNSALLLEQGTGTGLGGSGFVFVLDTQEAALATSFTSQHCTAGLNCAIGGGFSVTNTNDGNESLFTTSLNPSTPVVPEPASIFLLGTALTGLMVWKRKRTSAV